MSIQSEINRLKQVVSSAYTAIGDKGGTVPSSKVSGNLVSAIESIPAGAELNFEVVGGTSAPSNPKENTIWVNTSDDITSWVFSVHEPTNPTPGMVWIATGTSSVAEFNALKENGIQLCLLSASQYVGDGWEMKNAMVYQDQNWAQFAYQRIYLYRAGDQCTAVTGGWERKKYGSNSSVSITFNSDNMTMNATGTESCVLGCKSFDQSVLTNAKTMYVEYTLTKNSALDGSFGIVSKYPSNDIDDEGVYKARKNVVTAGTFTQSLDISSLTAGYPMAHVYKCKMAIKNIWLEY